METINESKYKKCAHVPCQCSPVPGSNYCSPACEKAIDETDCSCGHTECRAEAYKQRGEYYAKSKTSI